MELKLFIHTLRSVKQNNKLAGWEVTIDEKALINSYIVINGRISTLPGHLLFRIWHIFHVSMKAMSRRGIVPSYINVFQPDKSVTKMKTFFSLPIAHLFVANAFHD